jgi:hypothetical protein
MCEYSASNYGGNVTTWAYATRTNDEEAMKVVVAKYGIHFYSKSRNSNFHQTTKKRRKLFVLIYFQVLWLYPLTLITGTFTGIEIRF